MHPFDLAKLFGNHSSEKKKKNGALKLLIAQICVNILAVLSSHESCRSCIFKSRSEGNSIRMVSFLILGENNFGKLLFGFSLKVSVAKGNEVKICKIIIWYLLNIFLLCTFT